MSRPFRSATLGPEAPAAVGPERDEGLALQVEPLEEPQHGHGHGVPPDGVAHEERVEGARRLGGGLEGRPRVGFLLLLRARQEVLIRPLGTAPRSLS